MKTKKTFGSLAILAITAIASFNVTINPDNNGLSDVSLENVEALAQEATSKLWSLHCGSRPGTQCQSSVTGPVCPTPSNCP